MPVVGKDIPHDSARGHVTGESMFIDDMPAARNELIVDFIGSPVAHGKLTSIELDDARNVPGVVAIYTHKDVPGHNHIGPVVKDETLLVDGEAVHLGQPVVLIAAESREAIRAAKKLIKVNMDPLPPIFSIDEAIAAKSFLGPKRTIARGDAHSALAKSENVLEGSFEVGGQEQFYLENQSALAYPGEAGQMTVHSSTQHPTEVQSIVAELIGVPFNHVTCICKRMGGGFGGKETQAAAAAAMAAMVAHLTRRPARVVYNKDDDMRVTGKRHPFKCWYKVGFDDSGSITALVIDHYSSGGCSVDLSFAVLERAMMHTDNAYFLSDCEITGQVCKTNLPSNTAFRGFGGPQGVAAMENIIESIAHELDLDSLEVRRRNLYGIEDASTGSGQARNTTPYGQIVHNNMLPRLFDELPQSAEYDRRRREIDSFNANSKTHVKGMSLTPVKFGISFTHRTLNQANALVNIYTDGTVMVSTGGTEMGQGVNTRVRQIVADELGVKYEHVIIAPTSTDKNNNTSPTAASAGTDLNGAAAVDACSRLRERLIDYVTSNVFAGASSVRFEDGFVWDERAPTSRMTFQQVVCRAYLDRINLGERGFYATPGIHFDRDTGKGHPFLYFTNGAACSEVIIDRFTGEMRVTRVDLLMDVGVPINPGIDRGQVVGGFIQGMGWCTNEELRYSPGGDLLTHSPTTYKIPNIGDVPDVFNVKFLDNPDNAISLRRSKAVGEPPLLLGISVWAAAKNALSYLSGEESPKLTIPATGEKLLMLISDYEAAMKRSDSPVAVVNK